MNRFALVAVAAATVLGACTSPTIVARSPHHVAVAVPRPEARAQAAEVAGEYCASMGATAEFYRLDDRGRDMWPEAWFICRRT